MSQPDYGVEAADQRVSGRPLGGGTALAEPLIDLKALHAKIGQLTLENDFSEGALTKVRLLSATR